MKVNLNTQVDANVFKWLDVYAAASGKSKASIVNEALWEYLRQRIDGHKNDQEQEID